MTRDEARRATARAVAATGDPRAGAYRSETLFGGRQEIDIDHRGQRYVLRITRHGKLILNKWNEVGDEQHDDA